MKFFIAIARDWYGKNERPISSASLVIGFIFEWFTLEHIDQFWENLWVAAHFLIIAILLILVNFHENKAADLPSHKDASKTHFWYLTFLQGFFGGLLSTFLVFYFRSATLAVSWPFLLILAAAFIANESFKKNYERLIFQICLFYLMLLTFTIYIVPVFIDRIGPDIFLISGLISLFTIFIFVFAIGFFAKEKFKKQRSMLAASVLGIFLLANILYFLNLIPPIPLSIADAGIYHSLYKDASGNYVVSGEVAESFQKFFSTENFHWVPGSPIYAYSAIYSPALFNTEIIHEWQRYDENAGDWVVVTRVNLSARGGRDEGWRIYSMKTGVSPGSWRVNVETADGQVIGRLRFDIVQTDTPPILKTYIK
ncbi:hypothetical protein A2W54_02890 [Candidatus Giovannonibacteria bacterium RIFCSPHIGHO2_02_43_13]|uniref:DUF2914 domain-containing protein n=1 Tax=Candidatus Giovannonibacteria bacterium RIFCSPHIGHO2_02_43_13 TaxID=1798330 RepID=A0A1F5WPV3_9BACT|nr:MAG: hypothetical protein UW28_C0003G0041 [Parcubacteria group bacterium GW2011_GWA2_44_13]OGF72522.1 MAG: hypothetical protein A3E06_03940 [Candidatus Giovannonibacteria bacterium RIFCSPHIGHO2_12_FULL_44_42]OGF77689.1 MAG: hypothetical protein A2W54_02890 [Candidatus Giovannonibacteria bacterium RIFCSPHIGHO2_02_43_13]OGF88965.1 MAG: hypothetical protein A3I94_03600 [Candidatus Giovannonibacteria bacterium RIFCSPLOWO2_02_FULL_43_54]OGF97401.1 MAG: hypothetical protein A3H08_03950 [Candidatus